ncbi:MAG TPA: CopD family protein, partial [Paenirhodobacter sp.]
MIDLLLIVCRGVVFVAALMLWGGAVFRWRLMPQAPLAVEGWLIGVLIVGLVATLPVRVAQMAGGWGDMVDGATVWLVLRVTGAGQAWIVQVVALAGLMLARRRDWRGIGAIAAGVVLAAQALTGHSAATPGWPGFARQANDVVHMLAAGAWLGALPYVLRLLPQIHQDQVQHILIHYSREGHVWVALVLLTGILSTLLTVRGLPVDWSHRYQMLLCLKALVTAAMIGLALRNRYGLVPRLRRDPGARDAMAR